MQIYDRRFIAKKIANPQIQNRNYEIPFRYIMIVMYLTLLITAVIYSRFI